MRESNCLNKKLSKDKLFFKNTEVLKCIENTFKLYQMVKGT